MIEEENAYAKVHSAVLLIGAWFLLSPALCAASPRPYTTPALLSGSQPGAAPQVPAEKEPAQDALEVQQLNDEADPQDKSQDLYTQGQDLLDQNNYSEAEKTFAQLAQMGGPQTDAALYWKAYADNKLGNREAALQGIADLKNRFPSSKWTKDAEALEIEMRQNSGLPVNPDSQNDNDLKILALQGIINKDPAQGIPQVEKFLNSSASPKEKSRALYLLVETGSPQAMQMLAKIARGQSNPELQRRAIEYLGIGGGKDSGKLLADVYSSSSDPQVKRAVLHSFMVSGNSQELVAVAKKETNPELKREAIHEIGLTGARADLLALYQSETSVETKKEIVHALFLADDSERLSQLAASEQNPELRKAAIQSLGLLGAKDPTLQTLYAKETNRGVKLEILNAYFIGGNAHGLVAIAKTEQDPELKKAAVSKLALMNSKEGNEYLMELLK